MEIEVLKPIKVKANYLLVLAYPRYWEDSKLNNVYDDENSRTPLKESQRVLTVGVCQ